MAAEIEVAVAQPASPTKLSVDSVEIVSEEASAAAAAPRRRKYCVSVLLLAAALTLASIVAVVTWRITFDAVFEPRVPITGEPLPVPPSSTRVAAPSMSSASAWISLHFCCTHTHLESHGAIYFFVF